MKSLVATLGFLTRLPLSRHWLSGGWEPMWFPLVGGTIGLLLAGVARVAGPSLLALPEPVLAWIVVLVWVWVTGGLHLDGLMDTVDGLSSGTAPEQALEIMRDSRVGAMGVMAALLLLIGKFASIMTLATDNMPALTWCLLVIPLWARWGMSLALSVFPYARKEGMGSLVAKKGLASRWRSQLVAIVTAVAWTGILVGVGWTSWRAALPVILSITVITLVVGAGWSSRFGGLTGDMYGALNELSETFALLLGVILLV